MSAAQSTGVGDLNTGATQTVQFVADFLGTTVPGDLFTSDLYIVDGSNLGNVRQLTSFNKVVPEFYWNPDYTKLLWTLEDATTNPPTGTSYTASFSGIPAASQVPASTTPAWILAQEQPIDMTRVGAQAQVPTQL